MRSGRGSATGRTFGFYALFGFVAYVALIFLGKGLRALLMRPEDYYERDYRRPNPGRTD
jgi:hypothetical protein